MIRYINGIILLVLLHSNDTYVHAESLVHRDKVTVQYIYHVEEYLKNCKNKNSPLFLAFCSVPWMECDTKESREPQGMEEAGCKSAVVPQQIAGLRDRWDEMRRQIFIKRKVN